MRESCPYCAEEVAPGAPRCPNCGEHLTEPPQARPKSTGKTVAIVVGAVLLGLCLCFVPLVAAIAIPNLIEARKHGNEAAAIGALKTISFSQSMFREGDKDGNDILDYGTLTQLGATSLIDSVLASGTKQGYHFEVTVSPTEPEFLWSAVANPAVAGTTGDRAFATDHTGIIYYSFTPPIVVQPDGTLPAGLSPIGR